jgi:hypothetical protein
MNNRKDFEHDNSSKRINKQNESLSRYHNKLKHMHGDYENKIRLQNGNPGEYSSSVPFIERDNIQTLHTNKIREVDNSYDFEEDRKSFIDLLLSHPILTDKDIDFLFPSKINQVITTYAGSLFLQENFDKFDSSAVQRIYQSVS